MLHFSSSQHGRSLDQQAGHQAPELLESSPHTGPIPAGVVHDDAHSVAEHLQQLRTYAYNIIDPPLIEDRNVLRRQDVGFVQELLYWMALMAFDDLFKTWSTSDPPGHGV